MAGLLIEETEKLGSFFRRKKTKPVGAVTGGAIGGAAGAGISLTRPTTLKELTRILANYKPGTSALPAAGKVLRVAAKRGIPLALILGGLGALSGSKIQDVAGK